MTKIPYVTFMKHAQKVVKSPACKTRQVLGGVIHRKDYVAVTDSHRLYLATDMYEGEEKNVDPKTGVEIEGNYPDVERLLPNEYDAKCAVKINIDQTHKAVKLIEQAGKIEKASDFISIKRDAGDLIFSSYKDSLVECNYVAGYSQDGEPIDIVANAKYVSEAFALFKEAGFEEATFKFFGNMRPFTMTAGNLTALILPIRTYK